jgi:hypothetical protein
VILEGIVTTLNDDGSLNVAPMGPRVEANMERFVLRLFRTSQTFRNLERSGEGVLHVTDDVLLFARAAIGQTGELASQPAEAVAGRVLIGTCRYYEFMVRTVDHTEERVSFHVETVYRGRFGDWFGFNRAKHAVIEAAILATRTNLLPADELVSEIQRLAVIVRKTGGPREDEAFRLLDHHIRAAVHDRVASRHQARS